MRLLLLIILAFVALSILSSLLGPLIVLGIGAVLSYYAYKNLVKANKSLLGIIWWVIVGATGVSMIVGALPGFVFIGAVVALVYFAYRHANTKSNNKATATGTYENFETQWRDITNR